MNGLQRRIVHGWMALGPRFLPFADAASDALPLGRLLRLALFQVSIAMATVLLTGTLNRVMIVELGMPAWLVALMVALPLVFAPLRAFIGFRSDTHRSYLGWRRVPYIWMGTLAQFGGLAIMPFALLVLTGDGHGPAWIGHIGAALAFLLVGAGLHTTQTAGLALATDLAPPERRPRVIALLYVVLLVGTVASGFAFSILLADFSPLRLVQVVQGAAMLTFFLNVIALWQQEPRDPSRTPVDAPQASFRDAWQRLRTDPHASRLLVAVGLGTVGFSMQDVLLEPYGGQILGLAVGETTGLTALAAAGALVAFAYAARRLARGGDPHRLAAGGALTGTFAFAAVVMAQPLGSIALFAAGTALIGAGGGLFSVGTMTAALAAGSKESNGIALGAWGAVQATSAGIAIFAGGALRDIVTALAANGRFGEVAATPLTGYTFVYHLEILFLFASLVAIGPLVRATPVGTRLPTKFGLAEFPGQ